MYQLFLGLGSVAFASLMPCNLHVIVSVYKGKIKTMSQQQTGKHRSKEALRAESCLENKLSEGTAEPRYSSVQFPHSFWASLSLL